MSERFTLQFSTGENIEVWGTGIIGRAPTTQPGEYVDHVIPVGDPSRSMSKTHLEFGQDQGEFWVCDRWSGNGTNVIAPDRRIRRCEPGKRLTVERGSRVELGDQSFTVG